MILKEISSHWHQFCGQMATDLRIRQDQKLIYKGSRIVLLWLSAFYPLFIVTI